MTVEIRSNNRYLDCSVKLPRVFGFAEDSVKAKVKEEISRGKVDVFISVNVTAGSDMKISLNRPVLEGYLSAMRTIAKDYEVKDDISVSSLTRFSGTSLSSRSRRRTSSRQRRRFFRSFCRRCPNSSAMRTLEGAALEQDLRSRAKTVLALVEKVEARSPVTLCEYRSRLTQKMQEVLQSTNIDEGRILQEAAIYADKIAVDEETVRLRSHLSQLDAMLTAGGAIGRKLDFLLQEFNREANTIGSKGNDLEQARTVVEIKAELEKIREQTQNIE
ncbi:MAG: YicC/YloC family endoribonuclease [Oscillospiraceae bacterium]